MNARSTRFRLTAWYAVLLFTGLALFGGAIWLSLRARLLGELDSEITATAKRFEVYFERQYRPDNYAQTNEELEEYCQALPPTTFLDVRGGAGYEFHYPAGRRPAREVRSIGMEFISKGTVYSLNAGESTSEIQHTLNLLGLLLLGLSPGVIAIACFGGAWLSRRALRPVDQMTAEARTIGIENLSQRLPVPNTGDELERLAQVWNSTLARLDAAVGTLSQFAADASHELRTPLAVIRTGAEIALRRERSPEAYREALMEIAIEAERMTQLVEDLLLLARTETRNAGMPLEALDLSELLEDTTEELRELADMHGVRFFVAASPARVSGNRTALRRLFLALLENAIKYSPSGGDVEVNVNASAAQAQVEIRDRGIGIAPEDLPKIFQRFYRSDKARGKGGHGLGLSLASTIAAAHGGSIDAESSEGAGSVFRVSIPRR